ncbi:MAG TPA: LD-carboxypeptidase [Candidatus Kapabacteria bacterium]|nr:LD-carboxypeptidase [Candidatus Kapabacteria bacterium]
MKNRREFIKQLAAGAIAFSAAGNLTARTLELSPFKGTEKNTNYIPTDKILPAALKSGSLIAIASPASPTSAWNLNSTINILKMQGFSVEIGRIARNQKNNHNYLAATDQERADELMQFFERPDVDAIMCARGGYGVMRILDKLDYQVIKNNPKIVIGFSDITALLNAIYAKCSLVTFHGPVAVSTWNDFSLNSFKKTLTIGDLFSAKIDDMQVINEGTAEGIIQGGNLRIISSTLGTPYEIQTNNSILFLEDVSEHAYEIDRMLTQLFLAGKMKNVRGIVFGKFKNLHTRKSFYPNRGKTIFEVIKEICKPLGVPLVYDFPFGHVSHKITLPIGIKARLDTKTKAFSLLEEAVC